MPDSHLANENVLPELYFLIANFLRNSPFRETSDLLIEQLEQFKVLPPRIDWTGARHDRSFHEMSTSLSHVPPNFLLQMCNQIRNLIENQLDINVTGLNSLLGIGQFSILQDVQKQKRKQAANFNKNSNLDAMPRDFYLKYCPNKNYSNHSTKSKNSGVNLIMNLFKRQIDGRELSTGFIQPDHYRSVMMQKRIFGHLSAVYCICFDRTGRYILTGADDNLIKAWSAYDGRLLATFRGHEKEISDIDINFENSLLASGSCDKTLRIWSLKTTECKSILQSHTSMVTSIEFSPYCCGSTRWLASSGSDGVMCFWNWNSESLEFNPKPKRFIEKSRPGSQMLCLSFSPGGLFLAAGSNDYAIRVYSFENGEPTKICEIESHTNWVDSIQFANTSARFLSGSKDGTAKIWSFEAHELKNILIDGSKTLEKSDLSDLSDMLSKKHSVTMVAWNCDDSLVITAQNNFTIKVWNSSDAQLVHELTSHSNEIFVLESHPKDPRVLLSAGHDGNVIIWNIFSGAMIKKFYNRIENEGHGCLFDTKWSCTSDMFASTDSHGNLTIFSFGLADHYKKVPDQLFFHTDYRPLMRDLNGFVLDEQTQAPPHLMPPPFLVDADGNPYDSQLQRLVPGREHLTDSQLVPHIITNENGLSEIIGDREADEPVAEAVRVRNAWLKSLINPLASAERRTAESTRRHRFDREKYDYNRGFKEIELSQKGSVYIYRDENSKDNCAKRGRTKAAKKGRAAHDDDTVDEQFIQVDDDNDDDDQERARPGRRVEYAEHSPLSSESTAPTDNSEWEHARPSRKKRKAKKRVLRVLDDDELADQASRSDDAAKSTLAKKLNKLPSDRDEDEDDEDEPDEEDEEMSEMSESADKPCTSRAAAVSRSPRKGAKKSAKKTRCGQVKKGGWSKKASTGEVTAECGASEWLSSVRPRKTPYVPQIGDEVVYFRQGHELYVEAVREKNLYQIDEHTLPSNKCQVKELCKITSIQIEIKPPRLVCLKLNVIEAHTGHLSGQKLTLKYHDMAGVADFVILRQHYEKSLQKKWQPKDTFRSYIDDSWYYGTIEAHKPFHDQYPHSEFQCFSIVWDSGDHDALSPWDLDEVGPREDGGEDASACLLYEPSAHEWHGLDRDSQCDRILSGIEIIRELSIAEPFNLPVDLIAFPHYAMVIGYPIDLNTIRERVANRYYRRVEAIEWDIRKIEEDAHEFNEPDSNICKQATLLTQVLVEFVMDADCSNPRPIYKRLCKDSSLNETQASPSAARRSSRRARADPQSATGNLRFNLRSRHQAAEESNQGGGEHELSSNGAYSWKDEAKKLLRRIIKHPDSGPFRQSVDAELYPDYGEVIKKPIDFTIIKNRLNYNMYNSDFDLFEKDCKLLFQNSKAYNTNKRSAIYSMTLRLESFCDEKLTEMRKRFEAAEQEKMRSNRSRRAHQQVNYFEGENNFRKLFKNASNFKTDNCETINKSNSEECVGPSTSGYATRSSSNRKINSLNSNSIPIYNENSNHSGTDDTEDNFSNDVLNRYMDEETQMALMDNIEYDLNDDYIDEESKINSNSKLTRNEATNFSNKFPKAEASESIECKPSTSNFKADTSKKTRLTKSESNTAMSNSDHAVSKNKRGRGKKVIQSDEDDTNASSDTEEYEENDTNRARMNGRSKKKINDDFYEDEDKSDSSSLDQEDDEDFDDDSFNQNEMNSSKKNRKKSKKAKKTRSNDKNSMSKRPVRSCRSMDNKENNETFLSRNKKSTLTKTASSYSTRSSKRARKADYREFSTSDDDSNDDESQQKSRKKRSNSRKKPKFSSSENLNF